MDDLEPHELENLRRSIVMLRPGQAASLDRDRAVRLLEELQRLQASDRRFRELVEQLRALLDGSQGLGETGLRLTFLVEQIRWVRNFCRPQFEPLGDLRDVKMLYDDVDGEMDQFQFISHELVAVEPVEDGHGQN